MPEQGQSDNASEQPPEGLQAPGAETPPDDPVEGKSEGQGGSWSPEVKAEVTRMRQQDRDEMRAELDRRSEQLRSESEARLQRELDLERQRRQASTEESVDLPEGVDPVAINKIIRSAPAFKKLVEDNAALRQQVRTNAIAGGMATLKGLPFVDEVRDQVVRDLQSQEVVGVGSADVAYRYRTQPILAKKLADVEAASAKLREEKRNLLTQQSASPPGGAAPEEPNAFEALSDEEKEAVMEAADEDQFAIMHGFPSAES